MDEQLDRVRRAYDLTVEQYRNSINPLDSVPEAIKNTDFYKSLASETDLNSGSPDIRDYLSPESGMRFLDVGCSANLANYHLGDWPSTYYGVDISPALIDAMKEYAGLREIQIGGLYAADISLVPFENDYFDITAAIGVLEYCTLEYIQLAIREIHRVLKPGAKAVIDIPNSNHPHAADMQKLEEYLERPIFLHPRDEFENILKPLFRIEKTDDSKVMIKYFVRSTKSL